ncbi:MAG: hypothetical protein ACM31L_06980 [Actinomycetota bacterium]
MKIDDFDAEWYSQALADNGFSVESPPSIAQLMGLTFQQAKRISDYGTAFPPKEAMGKRERRRLVVRKRLVGIRSEVKRKEIIAGFLAEFSDPVERAIAEASVRDVEEERGKRGRKPKGLRASTASGRARESRKRKEEELREAINWLRSRLPTAQRKEFRELFPKVAEFANGGPRSAASPGSTEF